MAQHDSAASLFRGHLLKIALSAFLAFHLFAVVVVPNSGTYLGMKAWPIFEPYVSALELANQWNFFAPDPPPPVYIEYELFDPQGESLRKSRWPESKSTRRTSAGFFMSASDERMEKMLLPFLCRQSPSVGSVKLWRVILPLPTREEVVQGNRTPGDESKIERRFVSHTFCEDFLKGAG